VTTIDGAGTNRVVVFESEETDAAVLEGFTIQHGSSLSEGVFGYGGGILVASGSPLISGNVIRNNQSCNGGGIAVINDAHPRISHNVIEGNETHFNDCSNAPYGGGIYISNTADIVVEANRIAHNVASYGGGVAVVNTTPPTRTLLMRNVIESNKSEGPGGGLYLAYADVDVVDSLIIRNAAYLSGGVHVLTGPEHHYGLLFDTIADNESEADLYVYSGDNQIDVINTIIRTTASKYTVDCHSAVLNFQDDDVFATQGARAERDLTNPTIMKADPLFLGGDGANAYRLQPASPAVDAGTDQYPRRIRVDLIGAPRNMGAAPDMGAFEDRGN
jgi:hypothetical protein